MVLKFINIVFASFIIFAFNVSAKDQLLNFEQAPFKPTLLVNDDPVCSDFLDETRKSFFSTDYSILKHFNTILQPYDLNSGLQIDGHKIYFHFLNYRGCGGACDQYQMMVDSKPINRESNFPNDFSEQIRNSSPEPTDDGSSIFFHHSSGQYLMLTLTDDIKIFRLNADAAWKKMCVISVKPTDEQIANSVKVNKSINLLELKLDAVLGQEGYMCGSMHTRTRKKLEAKENLRIALYRPWIWKEDSGRIMNILDKWAKKDISHKLVFDEYRQQLIATQDELAKYFQEKYGWSYEASSQVAKNALTGAVNSGFWFDEQGEVGADELRSAILQKMPLIEIKRLVEKEKNIPDQVLNLAVNQPEILDYLLEVIRKPDLQNEFNKTLLMYAAQYDQVESAKVLLKHGANPNLSTIIPNDRCEYTLSKSGMTALHYAVRYSSSEFIHLLLENGASPYLRTSEREGAHPVHWLKKYTANDSKELNPNLSIEEAIALELKLALPAANQIPKLVENFNLTAELAYKNQDYQKAYSNSINAIGLDTNNERALSDISLIALKMGRQDVALEAIAKLIKTGKDINQKANAWFNYGLNCKKTRYSYFNGQSYCDNIPIYYFLESYKLKPTDARKNRIIEEMKAVDCKFTEEEIYISDRVFDRKNKFVYVLAKSGSQLVKDQFLWVREHKLKDDSNHYVNVHENRNPDNLILLYNFEGYDLMQMSMKEYDDQPIMYKFDKCI